MTKGRPPATKPTWQTSPSSSISLMRARSYSPRSACLSSVVLSVGVISLIAGHSLPRAPLTHAPDDPAEAADALLDHLGAAVREVEAHHVVARGGGVEG